jgi:hypothetical protein
MEPKRESAVVPIPCIDVARHCDEIVSAAAALVVDLEFVSERVGGESTAALNDARSSVDRIVEIAQAIRRTQQTAPASSNLDGKKTA